MARRIRARYLALVLPGYILFRILTCTRTPETTTEQPTTRTRTVCVECNTDPTFVICPYQKEEDLYVSGAIRDTGIWDNDLTRLLKVALSLYKKATFIDLGAFIGYFTLYAGALGHDVLSVEPFNSSFKRLSQGLALNEFPGTISLINKALSNKQSFIRMGKNQKLNLGNMQVYAEQDVEEGKMSFQADMIETVTMNDLLKYIHTRQAIIKIDIEGYECKAMEMSSVFFHELFVPYIFMEWFFIRISMNSTETACEPEAAKVLVNYLTHLGYTPFAYHPWFKLLDPSEVLDWNIDDIFWQHKTAISLLPFISFIKKEMNGK